MENNNSETKHYRREDRYDGISFGIFLLFVGVLSLLINFGIIQWSWGYVFSLFASYWPIFIILLGIKIVVETLPYGKLLGLVLDIIVDVTLIGFLVYAPNLRTATDLPLNTGLESQTSIGQENFQNATKKNYSLTFGAANFAITDAYQQEVLKVVGPMDKNGAYYSTDAQMNGTDLNVAFENRFKNATFFGIRKNSDANYTLTLGGNQIPSTVNLNMGASQAAFDLSKTQITDFTASVGAGDLTLKLGGSSIPNIASLKTGAGRITLRLPTATDVNVSYKIGMGAVKVVSDSRGISKSFGGLGAAGSYQSGTTGKVVNVEAQVGAGEIVILLDN